MALFPLAFNLSFAQEVEVSTEEIESSWTEVVIPEKDISMSFSLCSEWQDNVEQPLTPSDSSPSREQNHESENFSPDRGSVEAEVFNGNIPVNPSLHSEWQDDVELIVSNEWENIIEQTEDIQESPDEIQQWQTIEQNSIQLLNNLELQNEELPKLKITEVYRLWGTERIEITNISDEEFLWNLEFIWVKSGTYNVNLNISAYSSAIISDNWKTWIIDENVIKKSSAWLGFGDNSGIYIELQYSWNLVDSFEVDESKVDAEQKKYKKDKNYNPSFQKIYNDGREVEITTTWDIYNISWFIANPWIIIIKSWNPWIWDWPSEYPNNWSGSWIWDNPWWWDETWNWSWDSQWTWSWNNSWNWNLTWESSDFKLILSEVYYDDDDEWIEIYNIWTWDFFGDIELSWTIFSDNKISHIYQNIQIPANDFIIFADSDDMFWDVSIQLNGWNFPIFSIPDDEEIQISLSFSWQKIDTFFVHKSRVVDRDDFAESFHKIMLDNWPVISFASTHYWEENNMSENTYKLGNPWILYFSADNIKDCSKEKIENSDPQDDEPLCSDAREDIVTISEIFRWWSRYDPYVEFSIHEDLWRYYDSLILSWSLLEQPIIMDLTQKTETYDKKKLQKNTKLILTTKAWALTEAGLITIILQPNLEFNSFSWELELYWIDGQSRQLLDIVKIATWAYEKSTYYSHLEHECWITMDNVNNFSPWFEESALRYFSTTSQYNEKIVEKVKYVGWGGGCSCPTKKELCGSETWNVVQTGNVETTPQPSVAPLTGSEISPLTGGVSQSDEGINTKWTQIKIVSLEPKSPESITLQSFLPYDIDFTKHNYYLKSSTATTKKYIDGILYSNTIDTFTKNFWFVDGWACVYLYSWDNQLDSYCYSSEKQQTQKEKSDPKDDSFNPSDYQISITHIDYDPDGSDSWNESITLKSSSSKALDLSKIKMKVNATNKKLTWILEPYSSITLTWSFWFPNSTKDNSDVVVIIFYDNYIFSTYTYNPNKPKVEIPDWAVKVYSVIDGDTFRYRKEDWSLQSVRLLGVDAPESNTARYRSTECFWKEAKNYLTNLLKNQYVTLEFDPNSAQSDAYGRMLAYVYLDWKLVNETLIAEWYAKEYTYKTSYTHQSSFKQAEENAKKSSKWLRSSSTCGKSIEEEPEAWGIDYEKLSIKISNVIYNPDWTDSWNEIVQLSVDNSQISTLTSIDFLDDFGLIIFPRSEYATWTTKNKKLSEFWLFDLSSSSDITLKWNFWLPNNRATCVSLNQWSYTFDTRCYNPNGSLFDDEIEIQTWDLSSLPNVKIQSIIPNPSWKDSWKEEITLLRTPLEDSSESQNTLDLSPDFSLLINWKTKKKLVWSLVPNQNITIKWSFWLPNSASCVSLLYKWETLDEFCYWKAKDGVKFNSDNTSIHEIPLDELAIVKKITLVKRWDKLCVSYNKTLFSCKSIPNSTTEKNKKLLSMQNNYISELEKYLKTNYSMIYYNSDIKEYFELYSDAKKAIKTWSGNFTRGDKNISLTDISALFQAEYQQDAQEYFLKKLQQFLPKNINLALHQLEEKYSKKLIEESDLSFLSYAE